MSSLFDDDSNGSAGESGSLFGAAPVKLAERRSPIPDAEAPSEPPPDLAPHSHVEESEKLVASTSGQFNTVIEELTADPLINSVTKSPDPLIVAATTSSGPFDGAKIPSPPKRTSTIPVPRRTAAPDSDDEDDDDDDDDDWTDNSIPTAPVKPFTPPILTPSMVASSSETKKTLVKEEDPVGPSFNVSAGLAARMAGLGAIPMGLPPAKLVADVSNDSNGTDSTLGGKLEGEKDVVNMISDRPIQAKKRAPRKKAFGDTAAKNVVPKEEEELKLELEEETSEFDAPLVSHPPVSAPDLKNEEPVAVAPTVALSLSPTYESTDPFDMPASAPASAPPTSESIDPFGILAPPVKPKLLPSSTNAEGLFGDEGSSSSSDLFGESNDLSKSVKGGGGLFGDDDSTGRNSLFGDDAAVKPKTTAPAKPAKRPSLFGDDDDDIFGGGGAKKNDGKKSSLFDD
jgi:hypothetical protein